LAKLRFFARDDLLVTVPGSRPMQGQAPQYVARSFVPGDGVKGAQYPATDKPYECEADSDEGRRLVLLTRRDGSLWPADAETAAACGVDFVAVSVKGGVAAPAPKAAPQRSSASRAQKDD
jgi:hypothetical protein